MKKTLYPLVLVLTVLFAGINKITKTKKITDMYKKILFVLPAMLLFFSCEKDDSFPRVENTTSGSKWTLQIESSPNEVYNQLQELGTEKNFGSVAIVYRKPFSKPEEIQNYFDFYHAITLQSKSGVVERAVINFNQDNVSSIEVGGALLDSTDRWPQNISDEISIYVNDRTDKIYEKLLAIYQIPIYSDYQLLLPDKSLNKPFDPDMTNYDEWAFDFSKNLNAGKVGRSFVRLYFNKNKLVKIRHEYYENEVLY